MMETSFLDENRVEHPLFSAVTDYGQRYHAVLDPQDERGAFKIGMKAVCGVSILGGYNEGFPKVERYLGPPCSKCVAWLDVHRPKPRERGNCPDGGYCHHECGQEGACFRVLRCGPLSIAKYPKDEWPAEVVAEHKAKPDWGRY